MFLAGLELLIPILLIALVFYVVLTKNVLVGFAALAMISMFLIVSHAFVKVFRR